MRCCCWHRPRRCCTLGNEFQVPRKPRATHQAPWGPSCCMLLARGCHPSGQLLGQQPAFHPDPQPLYLHSVLGQHVLFPCLPNPGWVVHLTPAQPWDVPTQDTPVKTHLFLPPPPGTEITPLPPTQDRGRGCPVPPRSIPLAVPCQWPCAGLAVPPARPAIPGNAVPGQASRPAPAALPACRVATLVLKIHCEALHCYGDLFYGQINICPFSLLP